MKTLLAARYYFLAALLALVAGLAWLTFFRNQRK